MNSFCKIYVSGPSVIDELRGNVFEFLKLTKVSGSFGESDSFALSIAKNDEFDKKLQTEFPDGFLYFKFIFEFDFKNKELKEFQVDIVSKTLEWLWGKNMAAVAACDYEEKLPENGGYKSLQGPWPKK
jgi:hypothetical protein